jgi:hypothetical protein
MRTVFAALIFAASLSSCALFTPEPWGKQLFTPSSQSVNTACDRALSNSDYPKIGKVEFSPKIGELSFRSRLAFIAEGCWTNENKAFIAKIASGYRNELWLIDTTNKRESIKVEISLERDGRELARVQPSEIEPRERAGSTHFWFNRFNNNEIEALETMNSLTIIINRAGIEDRYTANPTNLPGL